MTWQTEQAKEQAPWALPAAREDSAPGALPKAQGIAEGDTTAEGPWEIFAVFS